MNGGIERGRHLWLDEGALLFDHNELFEARSEGTQSRLLNGPNHAELVDVEAQLVCTLCVDAQQLQRVDDVGVALAGTDDSEAGLRCLEYCAVETIRPRELLHKRKSMTD